MHRLQIRIRREVWSEMLGHCLEAMPREACGLLFGCLSAVGVPVALNYVPIANVAANPLHSFELHPQELVRALYAAGGKQELVGIVHSHPRTAPYPSDHDLATLWHSTPSHWIVSLRDPSLPEVKAFAFRKRQQENFGLEAISYEIVMD
ncbi:M67 family metallopeptidase [Paenibacillus oleatilyticus]|uniref:M67 family metallopeptidase n=1 Tax=Paenibacillus oleatilyticus TaxID=2594886 RepID=UPI001C1FE0B7|nr:M67 family metallopeptidase [Paenibacillus oleatilyticus]MBU7320588.1 M67 family metallopeptidase [Paenibacillus oleatilyticus]